MFETELATYEANKARLLSESEGKFVAIRGSEILGRYPSYASAFEAGQATYGREPFLIKQILPDEPVSYSPPISVSQANITTAWGYSTVFH